MTIRAWINQRYVNSLTESEKAGMNLTFKPSTDEHRRQYLNFNSPTDPLLLALPQEIIERVTIMAEDVGSVKAGFHDYKEAEIFVENKLRGTGSSVMKYSDINVTAPTAALAIEALQALVTNQTEPRKA